MCVGHSEHYQDYQNALFSESAVRSGCAGIAAHSQDWEAVENAQAAGSTASLESPKPSWNLASSELSAHPECSVHAYHLESAPFPTSLVYSEHSAKSEMSP